MKNLSKTIKYHFGVTYRRKLIDSLLMKNIHYYNGVVLDIGGKNRGSFNKPKHKVQKWIFADIVKSNNPDILLDVMNMDNVPDLSIDVINATELFEHVEHPEQGINECYRILKNNGVLIITMPFLSPVHGDPNDFQRWTESKWRNVLSKSCFTIEEFEIMGRYFTVLASMVHTFIRQVNLRPIRWILYPIHSFLGVLTKLDNLKRMQTGILGNFTTGYFIIARKKQ